MAVARLARMEMWNARPSGRARAEEAVDLAMASGSAKALAYALIARATARCFAGEDGGLADAERAQAAAAEVGDYSAFVNAVIWARQQHGLLGQPSSVRLPAPWSGTRHLAGCAAREGLCTIQR